MPSLPVSNTDGATLVAAPPRGQFIRVLGLDLTCSTDNTTMSLKSNSTVIWSTDAANKTGGGGITINVDENRTMDCVPSDPLVLGVGGGGTVKGSIEYVILGLPTT